MGSEFAAVAADRRRFVGLTGDMSEWSVKRIAMVVGLSAVALMAASAEDQGAATSVGPPMMSSRDVAGARMTRMTTSSTTFFASPHIHATENGKCAVSSPDC